MLQVPFRLDLTDSDPLYEAKVVYWNREAGGPQRMIRVCVSDNDNTRIALSLMRFAVADHEDLDALLMSADARSQLSGARSGGIGGFRSIRNAQTPCSVKNEVLMLQRLRELCIYWLEQYPTTLADDVARLAEPGLVAMFSNERHALIQVKGEKEVLEFFREYADVTLRLFGIPLSQDAEFLEALDEIRETGHYLVYNYCRSVVQKLRNDENRKQESRQRNLNMALPTVV